MRRHELFQLARVKASCEIHQKAFKCYGDAGNDIILGGEQQRTWLLKAFFSEYEYRSITNRKRDKGREKKLWKSDSTVQDDDDDNVGLIFFWSTWSVSKDIAHFRIETSPTMDSEKLKRGQKMKRKNETNQHRLSFWLFLTRFIGHRLKFRGIRRSRCRRSRR